jgi:hypothetical protein
MGSNLLTQFILQVREHPRTWKVLTGIWLSILMVPFLTHAFRLAGLPDIPDPFDAQQFGRIDVAPPDNAYELYEAAAAGLSHMSQPVRQGYEAAFAGGWAAAGNETRAWVEQNREALNLYRRGSERRDALYHKPADARLADDQNVTQSLHDLARLTLLEAIRLEDAGDYGAAWNLYRVNLRSSRHSGLHGNVIERLTGASIHASTTASIVRWAASPQVDAARLRSALDDARSTYKRTAVPSVPLKVEYQTFLNLFSGSHSPKPGENADDAFLEPIVWYAAYPLGEPEMSRRVAKLAWANWLSQCDRPRRERMPLATIDMGLFAPDPAVPATSDRMAPSDIENWAERALLAKLFLAPVRHFLAAHDREQAREALLETALVLQVFYREHGAYPESADALVASTHEKLPVDVFGTGGPIHFRREPDPADGVTIWSIGLDGVDDDGRLDVANARDNKGDLLIRVMPPTPAE